MIRLAKPYITEQAIEAVSEVLRSGNLVQGQNVKQLEDGLQDYLEVKHALLVSSGTAALHLAMLALDISPGDEVIVPAFTYTATANVVEVTGAKAVLVDISTDDFCINASLIEEKISSKTRAIVPVHEFGQPADCAGILEIAKKHNLPVIEDAACAFGASYDGQMTGSIGDIGCFSLHPRKAITTGEGGILTTSSDKLAERLSILRNHGSKWVDGKLDFLEAGLNYRLTDFQAALGIHQLKDAEYLLTKRLEVAKFYDEALADISWLQTPKSFPERKMVYQSYHLLLDDSINRDQLIGTLKEKGIETNLGAQNVSALTHYRNKYGYTNSEFPRAFAANTQGLVLPLGEHLNMENLEYIAKTFFEPLRKSVKLEKVKEFSSHGEGTFKPEDFCSIGKNVVFESGVLAFHPENISLGNNVYLGHRTILKGYHKNSFEIGDNTWIGQNCFFHSAGGIKVGQCVGVGPGVNVLTSSHTFELKELPVMHGSLKFAEVVIEDGCDIGVNSVILPGVTIGKGAVVGAGSVVTKSIEPYNVVAGNPARVLRKR